MTIPTQQLVFFIFVFSLGLSFAQDCFGFLNIESLRQNTQSGFKGAANLGASGATGNTEVFDTRLTVQNIMKNFSEEYIAILAYRYGEASMQKNSNEGHIHLRYAKWTKSQPLALELFMQSEFNEFTNLILRNVAGSGVRVRFYDNNGLSLYSGLGGFYEKEDISDSGDQETLRANSYVSVKWELKEKFTASAILYYQPNTRLFEDYRFRTVLGLEYKLSSKLLMTLEYNRARDTAPPPLIEELDTSFMTGLSWKY
jgi:hypothetical protein